MVARSRPFGDFLAGVIKFLAADPVNGRRGLERFGRQHGGVRPDKTDFRVRLLLFDGLGHPAIVLQRRRAGVDDDVVEVLGHAEAFLLADVVRRAIEQFGTRRERGRLRQPGGIPVAGDFAHGLVARPGAAVKTVKTRR